MNSYKDKMIDDFNQTFELPEYWRNMRTVKQLSPLNWAEKVNQVVDLIENPNVSRKAIIASDCFQDVKAIFGGKI